MTDRPSDDQSPRSTWVADFLASSVVFLVALPLCIGIAVACGVPAERGLVTGLIGGIVVGVFSGAPILVSGPAASLIVPVVDTIQTHGLVALAPVVIFAGVLQGIAGLLRLGQWFRAVAPAVIQGMLTGIGVLIFVSQLHVCLDGDPTGSIMSDLRTLPSSLIALFGDGKSVAPLLISAATIFLTAYWIHVRTKLGKLALVPGQLISLLAVTTATIVFSLDVRFLDISSQFVDGLALTKPGDLKVLLDPSMAMRSAEFAFVASAATLLTANAIDQRTGGETKSDYDRELLAQGIGNSLTGIVGGLPMTGVIVRSSANVDAGAKTRLSTILHGIWILLFVLAAPQLLEMLPRASLGAILVYTGYKLVDISAFNNLYKQGRAELAIALITLFGVVFIDLFIGIVAGLAAAVAKIVYTFARLEIRSEPSQLSRAQELYLDGSATFLQIPRLAKALDEVPTDRELHVHIDGLDHIDHACLQMLSSWNKQREGKGQPGMIVEWDELTERYRNALQGGDRKTIATRSVMSSIWTEWKKVNAAGSGVQTLSSDDSDFLSASRVALQVDAKGIEDVVSAAAELLAPLVDASSEELTRALADRTSGHVVLGGGVSVPHTPLEGLDRSLCALVVTKSPISLGPDANAEASADLFFVLLAPEDDPRQHLQALAHVGRLCHDTVLLDRLRNLDDVEAAMREIQMSDAKADDDLSKPRQLALIGVADGVRANRLASVVHEALGGSFVCSDRALVDQLRALTSSDTAHFVFAPLDREEPTVLQALLAEEGRVEGGDDPCTAYLIEAKELQDEKVVAIREAR